MAEAGKNSRQFRAEVRKVLHILTNSLYTNREIFLRELVSNASDALDKLRYHMNRGESPSLPDLPLEITISLDKDAKVLTIADTGLGMTAEELAENLGTIARSGSEQFLADVAAENASKLPILPPKPHQAKKAQTQNAQTPPILLAVLVWAFIPYLWWPARSR